MLSNPLLFERPTAELARLHVIFLCTASPIPLLRRFTTCSSGVISIVLGLVLQAAYKRNVSGYMGGKDQMLR